MLALTDAPGVRVTHVLETHIHNDYVTGGHALAQATGAAYQSTPPTRSRSRAPASRTATASRSADNAVKAFATPGHTHTHLSYALEDATATPLAVFTGGSLLHGAAGRPDLLGPATPIPSSAPSSLGPPAGRELPDETAVHPTHGFGNLCSATQCDIASSTIGLGGAPTPP